MTPVEPSPAARISVLRYAPLVLLALLLAVDALPASAQHASLEQIIDALLDDRRFDDAFWGVSVVDIFTGDVLYERNARKNFVPASNAKLFTTAAALDQLGPDYRYRTRLYAHGNVVDGVLRGSLIIRGSADPTFGGRYSPAGRQDEDLDATVVLRSWADSLRSRGITAIDGDIIGDDDVGDDVPLGRNWSWDDEPFYYAARLSGLTFGDNVVLLRVRGTTAGAPATISWDPIETSYVEVVNETRTLPRGRRIDEGYERVRGTNKILVSSQVPAGEVEREAIAVLNPTRYAAFVLREVLLQEGIPVAGRAVDVDEVPLKPEYAGGRLQRIAVHTSVPLADITAMINKASQNLYAELLLKTLAAERPGVLLQADADVEPGSASLGHEVAKRTFARAGIDTSRIGLVDASGLSRRNMVTPSMTTSLLRYMWRHADEPVRSAFFDALPVAGVEGTMRYRLRQGPAYRRVRAKTGTLGGVSALSGYVTTSGGTSLAFSIMANHFTSRTSAARRAQDAVVDALARYSR